MRLSLYSRPAKPWGEVPNTIGTNKHQLLQAKNYIKKTFVGRVSSFACFFSFTKHETKRNSSLVSRNFACFANQNILQNFVSFRFVNSKISFRFAKFHLDSLCFATFHLVSYRFAKFHLVSFR
jgi:hypothetical protein